MDAIQPDGRLTSEHAAVLTDYLRGTSRLNRDQWHCLREAVDLLAQSTVSLQGRTYTFAQFYEAFIDQQFAEQFLQALMLATDLSQDSPRLQAATARQIVRWLQQQDFWQKGQTESRWLLTFCLYWWAAFAVGYAFELEIFRDLRAEGIVFFHHDLTRRSERLSAFDLIVMGQRGDVKYSTWFLTAERARTEGLDFFITRLYDEKVAEWLRVVLLKPAAWALIDGDTQHAALEDAGSVLPVPVSISAGATKLILIFYDDWKARVRLRQTPEGDVFNG